MTTMQSATPQANVFPAPAQLEPWEEDEKLTKEICARLKRIRIQVCGYRGQSHFCALLHLSPSTYNYYEKGRLPPYTVMRRVCRLTATPLMWLAEGAPSEFNPIILKKIEAPAPK